MIAEQKEKSRDEGVPAPVGDRANWFDPPFNQSAFQNIEELFPTRRVRHDSRNVRQLGRLEYTNGKLLRIDDDPAALMRDTHATGLILAQHSDLLIERYSGGADDTSSFLSFSVSKSIVSTLAGIAIHDGQLALDQRLERYLPELIGSAYDGVTVRDVLRMASGISFDEVYENSSSGIADFLALWNANTGGVYDLSRTYERRTRPGSKFNYASIDTEVLGVLLSRVAGDNLSNYLSRKLWAPMGAEADARWVLDAPGSGGRELASAGICARLRDWARFGMLIANEGVVDGRQIVPAAWLREATTPSAEAFNYGRLLPDSPLGYGYQWWLSAEPRTAFFAMGVFGQFIIIDSNRRLVLACAGSWPAPFIESCYRRVLEFFFNLTLH